MGSGGSKGATELVKKDPINTTSIKEDPIDGRFQDYENPIQFNINTVSDNRYIIIFIIIFLFILLILKSLLFKRRKKIIYK
jgi:hypothetical protein